MLARRYRLSSRNAVRRASRYGKKYNYQIFSLRCIESHHNNPRIAVVVSKKVHKSAVARNRIKRKVTEVIRQNLLSKFNNSSQDIVIFIHDHSFDQLTPIEVSASLNNLFKKAHLY